MSRVGVLVVRRFNVKANGLATIEQVVKQLELPALPSRDMVLDFNDGTVDAVVSMVRLSAMGAQPPAVGPPRVEIRTRTEEEEGAALDVALAAGWVRLAEPVSLEPRSRGP
jgi:hypothetical protein